MQQCDALCRLHEPKSPLFQAIERKDLIAVRAVIDMAKTKGQVRLCFCTSGFFLRMGPTQVMLIAAWRARFLLH